MSSEDTTGRISGESALLGAIEAALCGGGEEQFDLHVTHPNVATAAVEGVRAWLAGRVVVDLPEPDEKRDRAGRPEWNFHVGSADVWNTWTDGEPRIRMTQRASGSGVHFSPHDARSFAAAILAAADAAERLSVPGSSGEARHG